MKTQKKKKNLRQNKELELRKDFEKYERLKNERVLSNNFISMYVDITIRGMISFLTLGMFSYFVLYGIFNLGIIFILPFIFIVSVLISPLLSKIKLGDKVQNKYENFLRGVVRRIQKWLKK